ncbi:MAG: CHAT domain protein [Elusimicrobia bacterium ADurb.Bin231]|nr:MAG: CHAT domain protein [Elusimicrobia bacterium ADurb.Bin231]
MEQAGGKERDAIKAGFDWYVEKISATIFKPVEEFLKEIDRLIIVPHLSLHYLPFSALINTEGRRLIEKYEIVNLPSPRLLKKTGKTVTLSKLNALIIGNPLGDLKYAGKEARIISKILLNSKLLSGKNANKAAILKLLPDYSILHFACHARIDYDKPLFSGLIVSDGKGCKARIELNEILEIKNKADLVVLSGCETSGGNITPGDEITCFPRAFMYSGASSLLVSLWEIDDNSTSEFMKYFYTELYVNGKTKSEALEMAQLQMVEAGYSPYHWSGFQLVGT